MPRSDREADRKADAETLLRRESRLEATPAEQPGAPSVRLDPGTLVAERFRIVTRLGTGAMGEVYRADDLRLAQSVALKFLAPELARDPEMVERLAAEVRIGRQLAHPNLCRLYDLVEHDGSRFVAMEYIDGEDLATLLQRIGRLPRDRALGLFHELAAGLGAAHELGVVHRDLKPANVMIDGRGTARITDFGLAVEAGAAPSWAGTPAYMAPEQLASERASERSDLYALGLVMWEGIAGRRLFDADTLPEIRRQHRSPKERPSSLVGSLDPALESAILACLEEDPARRPSSVRELLARLPDRAGPASRPPADARHPSEIGSGGRSSSEAETTASVVVLPFEELGSDQDDWFAAGLAEEIIGDLAKIRQLRVISRGSAMRFKGAQACRPIAAELGVRYVLTGSVRRADGRLRIQANLVDGRDESLAWSERFGGTFADVFDIQEQIARSIAARLELQLSADETRLIAERPIADPVAFEYYLRARDQIWSYREDALETAIADLEKGLAVLGEDNVLLLSALGSAWWQLFNGGLRPDPVCLDRAEEIAARIFEIQPGSHHGHRLLGLVAVSRGNVRECILHLRRVAEIEPSDTDTMSWLAIILSLAGLVELARPVARRIERLDPLGPVTQFIPVLVDWFDGRFERAAEGARRSRMAEPENPAFFYFLWATLQMTGRREEAAMLTERIDAADESFFTRLLRFHHAALEGNRDTAEAMATLLAEPAREDLQYSVQVAEGWSLLGDVERALEWIENAIDHGFCAVEFLSEHDRFLEAVRHDPRFEKLIERAQTERDELRAFLARRAE
ncbi:MAG TPA: protein kinase [Thermoanaerobaculia bacterium]|nr:protein kinase [Thermoanaerobaculia bacterium]